MSIECEHLQDASEGVPFHLPHEDHVQNANVGSPNLNSDFRGVAQVACNLWGPQAVEAFRVLRWVLSRLRALTLPALGVFGRAG